MPLTAAIIEDITKIALKPGTNAIDVWRDGVEVCGSLDDLDDSAGFVAGEFTPDEVRAAFPWILVVDCRDEATLLG